MFKEGGDIFPWRSFGGVGSVVQCLGVREAVGAWGFPRVAKSPPRKFSRRNNPRTKCPPRPVTIATVPVNHPGTQRLPPPIPYTARVLAAAAAFHPALPPHVVLLPLLTCHYPAAPASAPAFAPVTTSLSLTRSLVGPSLIE